MQAVLIVKRFQVDGTGTMDLQTAVPARYLDSAHGPLMRPGLSSDIIDLSIEHVLLVAIAMGIAIAISVPAGILLTRRAGMRPWVLGFANIMQTIPSLALFGFLIPVPLIGGIGKQTAIVALVLYALLPILRNTMTGILAVDPA